MRCRSTTLTAAALTLMALACPMLSQVSASDPFSTAPGSSVPDANTPAISTAPDRQTTTTPLTITTNAPATGLSATRLMELLNENLSLMVEMKEQAAERLTERGLQTDPNDLTDQMLFDQLAQSDQLRSQLTSYLRARGYISDAEIAASIAQPLAQEPAAQTAAPARVLPLRAGEPAVHSESAGDNPERLDDQEPHVLHRPAPYNTLAMRDLYTQVVPSDRPLRRFGSSVFVIRDNTGHNPSGQNTPSDVPLGPDYVLGAGDTLSINFWGATSQSYTRLIDRDGRVLLPEAGALQIAGLTLDRAQSAIEAALRRQFRDIQASVTVSRLRTVRIYVAGDVQRPGGYDISSLGTPLSALIAAGGPTATGSLRIARHFRGTQMVETVDLYDFLLHGVHVSATHFESGDTLLVPPAGIQVAITGAVRRPAIYELLPSETTLQAVLAAAGQPTPSAALDHITIERITAGHHRETITLTNSSTPNDAETFLVRDGDHIYIPPILPYSEQVVYVQGHVVRPGRLAFRAGMRLTDVLSSYRDMLPEPSDRGEVLRLVPPDLHVESISFDVPDVLTGNDNLMLQPFDTVRVFSRYEQDAPKVTIRGEVLRPGVYPLSAGMTASGLLGMAGGFTRSALKSSADLASYDVRGGSSAIQRLSTVQLSAALAHPGSNEDVSLKAGDVLTVHQIAGWEDLGQSIDLEGQITHPGSYTFRDGERLSAVLGRAGGFREGAYPEGAILVREQVREIEEKSREELVRQIEANSAAARLSPSLSTNTAGAALDLIKTQQTEILEQLKNHPPTGRLVIHISANIDAWANTEADIPVRAHDKLMIPKTPAFVVVSGQVYNPTALTFTSGKNAAWYLSRAGGANTTANRKEIFIIHANGAVVGRHSRGLLASSVLSTRLEPGDVIVVPQKILGSSMLWRNLLTTAQLASSIAITAAVAAL